MNSFLAAVEQLHTLDADNAFSQVLCLFETINTLDQAAVIAAYQAVDFFCKQRGQDFGHEGEYPAIHKALRARMIAITNDTPRDRQRYVRDTFVRSTPVIFSIVS
jgi:hypothetical protein